VYFLTVKLLNKSLGSRELSGRIPSGGGGAAPEGCRVVKALEKGREKRRREVMGDSGCSC